MEATVLTRALSTVSAAISPKSKLAVLREVLLDHTPAGLRLMGTDLETMVIYQLPPNGVVGAGALTAPVESFVKLVKTLKGEVELTLEPETATTRLTAGDLKLTLRGRAPTEHLAVEPRPADGILLATVDAAALQDALKRVMPVVRQDDDQPSINSVHLAVEAGDSSLTVEGANGHTLHTLRVPLLAPAPVTADALISLKQVQKLLKALAESGAQVLQLYADPEREPAKDRQETPPRRLVLVWTNADGAEVEARIRLTEGTYPTLSRIIPQEPPQQTISVSVKAMLEALKKLQTVEPFKIAIETEAEEPASLELTAITYDGSELAARMPCTWEGEALGTLVDPAYLEANLKAQMEDQVALELRYRVNSEGKVCNCEALVFRSGTLVAVTMPMLDAKGGCRWQR